MYSRYYNTSVHSMSADHQWAILKSTNGSTFNRNELLHIPTKKVSPLPTASEFTFTDSNHVVYLLPGQAAVFRNLKSGKEVVRKGNYIVTAFEKNRKIVLKDDAAQRVLVCSPDGDVLWHMEDCSYARIDYRQEKLYFSTAVLWGVYNLKDSRMTDLAAPKKIDFMTQASDQLLSLGIHPGELEMNVLHIPSVEHTTTRITLPEGFTVPEFQDHLFEVRENRYLLVPVIPLIKTRVSQPQIYYSNQNSALQEPVIQLSIYDLQRHIWIWKPNAGKPYQNQIAVSDKGDFIQYDYALNKVDTLLNPKSKIELIRNYGEDTVLLKTQYYNDQNFFYDADTGHFLFFENARWHSENITTGMLKEAPFEKEVILLDENFSGLSDAPAGKLVPTNRKGHFIVQTQNDLYVWDVVNNTVQRLTHGNRAERFEMLDQPLWTVGDSSWSILRENTVDLSKPFIVKIQNSLTDECGLASVTERGIKTIATSNSHISDVFTGKNILYTTRSYNEPLSLYELKGGKRIRIFQSKGLLTGERSVLAKELIHYHVDGKMLHAYLLYPNGFDKTKKYPMIVQVYEKMTQKLEREDLPALNSFSGINPLHYTLNGYFVLLPDLEYGVNDNQKILLDAVSSVINKASANTAIDRNSIAIIGNSFGGYEAALLMGRTNLFKTAVIGVPITDVIHFALSVNNMHNTFRPDFARAERQQFRMITSAFENWEGYVKASPLYYIPQIKNPVLLWGGGKDTNVNPGQVQSYFFGFKRLQKKAAFLNYQNEGHAFTDPVAREDLNYKIWQWLEYCLKGAPAADWILPLNQ